MKSGVEGEVDYDIKIFNRDNDSIIIVFNIGNKIRDLGNLGKFLKYNYNDGSIINTNIFIKSIINIV